MTRPCTAPRWTRRARIEAAGGRVTRVRLDAELKQIVATATEKARAEGGDREAHEVKLAAAHDLGFARRQSRPRVVSRRPARHRGRRWCERPGERGDCVRPLPRGGDRGEGRRGLCHARHQPIGHPDDRPRARPRNRRRPRRRTLAARPRWIGGAVDATHRGRRRVDRHDPGPHGAARRPAVRLPGPHTPASSSRRTGQHSPPTACLPWFRLSSRSTPQRARPGSPTSGEKSIWWNGRSGAARAAIRSWPDRCSSRNGETSTNDAQAHWARLENMS